MDRNPTKRWGGKTSSLWWLTMIIYKIIFVISSVSNSLLCNIVNQVIATTYIIIYKSWQTFPSKVVCRDIFRKWEKLGGYFFYLTKTTQEVWKIIMAPRKLGKAAWASRRSRKLWSSSGEGWSTTHSKQKSNVYFGLFWFVLGEMIQESQIEFNILTILNYKPLENIYTQFQLQEFQKYFLLKIQILASKFRLQYRSMIIDDISLSGARK